MASSIRYVLKAWFPAIPIIKPQCFRADQSQGIYFAGSIKKVEVLSIRVSDILLNYLLFQPIIGGEFSVGIQIL